MIDLLIFSKGLLGTWDVLQHTEFSSGGILMSRKTGRMLGRSGALASLS